MEYREPLRLAVVFPVEPMLAKRGCHPALVVRNRGKGLFASLLLAAGLTFGLGRGQASVNKGRTHLATFEDRSGLWGTVSDVTLMASAPA